VRLSGLVLLYLFFILDAVGLNQGGQGAARIARRF